MTQLSAFESTQSDTVTRALVHSSMRVRNPKSTIGQIHWTKIQITEDNSYCSGLKS